MKTIILASMIYVFSVHSHAQGVLKYADDAAIRASRAVRMLGGVSSLAKATARLPLIKWVDTHQMGRFGDSLTVRRMTGMGYSKLESKINNIHGLDGVYLKKEGDKIKELIIVENKVNSSQLSSGQMSDKWLGDKITQMLESENTTVKSTGELLQRNRDKISTQLWQHDLENQITRRYELINGEKKNLINEWNDSLIANQIEQQCKSGNLICDFSNR